MTNRCFSSSQLYALRNEINVQMLIEKTLRIPCRVTKGCFRFLCPLCNGFDTAVNPKTNLARCFHCEKNFNAIDLVMLDKQADFVQSAKFLQSIHQKNDVSRDRGAPMTISGSNQRESGCRVKPKTPSGKSEKRPHPIGEILDGVLSPIHAGTSEKRSAASKSNTPMAVRQITDEDRIVMLERQLEYLGRQIEKIARTINIGLASK
jgi:hypothetical protein